MALCLIAQTPRAGQWNHRLIVPPGHGLSEAKVLGHIAQANKMPCGKDYFAVRHAVRQAATGREGWEVLVLIGVAGTKLSPAQQENLQHKLEALLPRLGELVTVAINWHTEGKQLLVKRDELAQWAEELAVPEEWLFRPFWRRGLDMLKNIAKRLQHNPSAKS